MSIDKSAGFNRRNSLASFFIGGTERAQTPTTLNMLAWYACSEAGK